MKIETDWGIEQAYGEQLLPEAQSVMDFIIVKFKRLHKKAGVMPAFY